MTSSTHIIAQNIIELTAGDLMTEHILNVSVNWSVQRLADFFVSSSISGAPVLSPIKE